MKRFYTVIAPVAALGLMLSGCGIFKGGGGGEKKSRTPVLGERMPVLTYDEGVIVDPTLSNVEVALPAQVANPEWTQPGGSATKTMGQLALGANIQRVWSVKIGGGGKAGAQLLGAPVISGGKLYTIDAAATVHAFDAKTGSSLWQAQAGGKVGKDGKLRFGGGVAISGDKLFATSGTGMVTAFNAATGRAIWETKPGGPLRGAAAVAGGRVFVVSQDNQLFALDADNGKPLWDMSGTIEAAGILGAASPSIADGTVVAGFSSGELYALRVENGRAVWQDALSRTGISTAVSDLSDIDASPVIDQGRVFAVGHGGRMAAMELATGQRVWEINIAGIATPWVAGDWVFVVTADARLLCISRGTGKVRWSTQLPAWKKLKKKTGPIRWSGPVLAGDRLFLTESTGKLVTVSPTTGKQTWEAKLGGAAYLPPVVADNMLYVLTDDGRLSAWR